MGKACLLKLQLIRIVYQLGTPASLRRQETLVSKSPVFPDLYFLVHKEKYNKRKENCHHSSEESDLGHGKHFMFISHLHFICL